MKIPSLYKQRILATQVKNRWNDGVEMAIHANAFHLVGGWNSDENPQLNSEHWTVSLDGKTITRLPNAPFDPTHTFLLFDEGGFLWAIRDGVIDTWRYSLATGWQQMSSKWNIDNFGLDHFSRCYDSNKKYAYIAGGHKHLDTYTPNMGVYRSHLSTNFTQWTRISTLPKRIDSGCLVPFKDIIALFGGGWFSNSNLIPNGINTNIYHSPDEGFNWVDKGSNPLFNSGLWGDAQASSDAIIYIPGSDVNNSMTANNRALISYNALNFYHLPLMIAGRHATARCKDAQDNIYFSMGFRQNDLIKYERQ